MSLKEFDYTGALLTNPFPGVINGSLWSIKYEFFCYLGVALLSVTTLLRRRFVVLALLLGAWVVSIMAEVQHWTHGGKFIGKVLGSPQFWARLLPLYLAGVVFYLFRDRIPLRWWLAALSILLLIAGCYIPSGVTAMFPFAGTYLLFWLAFSPHIQLQHFGRFGDFSYGTYLYAFPIEQLIVRALGHAVAPASAIRANHAPCRCLPRQSAGTGWSADFCNLHAGMNHPSTPLKKSWLPLSL